MIDNELLRLQKAKEEELKIKLLVLQILLDGLIDFNTSKDVLDEEIIPFPLIRGKG